MYMKFYVLQLFESLFKDSINGEHHPLPGPPRVLSPRLICIWVEWSLVLKNIIASKLLSSNKWHLITPYQSCLSPNLGFMPGQMVQYRYITIFISRLREMHITGGFHGVMLPLCLSTPSSSEIHIYHRPREIVPHPLEMSIIYHLCIHRCYLLRQWPYYTKTTVRCFLHNSSK